MDTRERIRKIRLMEKVVRHSVYAAALGIETAMVGEDAEGVTAPP